MRFHFLIITTLLIISAPRWARADGGIIRLRETQGSFVVTVFSSPEISVGGFADISVLVQEKEIGNVVLDADVSLALNPPGKRGREKIRCGVRFAGSRDALAGRNKQSDECACDAGTGVQ
jgi:hypothetical protein